jgi:hypothetical protein
VLVARDRVRDRPQHAEAAGAGDPPPARIA